MFFSKPKSWLGIDFGAGGVKLVELKSEKHRPVLFTYAFTSIPHDVHSLVIREDKTVGDLLKNKSPAETVPPEQKQAVAVTADEQKVSQYAGIIRSVCKEAKTVSKQAVVSLPVSAVFHTVVNLPIVKKQDFDNVLKAEVTKLLPYALTDMALDYELLPRTAEAKVQTVLVNAVPKKLVLFYSQVFQRAGLKLVALETESVALARSLVGRDTALSMIIDVGAERTNFFIIDQTIPITHHTIELGGKKINAVLKRILDVPEDAVEQLKHDLFGKLLQERELVAKEQFIDTFMPIFDPILKEIGYSFDLYLRQSGNEGKRPEKIIFTGGGSLLPFLAERCSELFKMKCYIGDPWGRVVYQEGLKPLLREIGPRMAVAIGLALRSVS